MNEKEIDYRYQDDFFKGYVVFPESYSEEGSFPAILIAPAWMGPEHMIKQKARQIAQLGYIAFIADLYGQGKVASTTEEATSLMEPLFFNRPLLLNRVTAAYEAMKILPGVNRDKLGAIGFCFGGLTAIELYRSGADLRGTVSFHAVLGDERNGQKAQTLPMSKFVRGSILILHGYLDPLVSQTDLLRFQEELSAHKLDWQLTIYGQASHAFTNPEADQPESGLLYHAEIAARSWIAMRNFFEEIFA